MKWTIRKYKRSRQVFEIFTKNYYAKRHWWPKPQFRIEFLPRMVFYIAEPGPIDDTDNLYCLGFEWIGFALVFRVYRHYR